MPYKKSSKVIENMASDEENKEECHLPVNLKSYVTLLAAKSKQILNQGQNPN